MKPECLRECVALLKKMASLRRPNYELPTDSFLEEYIQKIAERVLADEVVLTLKDRGPPNSLSVLFHWSNGLSFAMAVPNEECANWMLLNHDFWWQATIPSNNLPEPPA